MGDVIAWERADGGISYEIPAYNDSNRPAGDTDQALIERCVARTGPRLERDHGGPAIPHIIPVEEFPADQTFRDAWEWQGGAISVNMPRARIVHMAAIRVSRDAELAKLDITFMRAIETGDTAAQSTIGTEKQALRDIPQTFDLSGAATPEALDALWPAELPSRG